MKVLTNSECEIAQKFFAEARREAMNSLCYKRKCGAVIVKENLILGAGYNSPPGNIKLEKCLKDSLPSGFKSDKDCCIHAERRAIDNSLSNFSKNTLKGSTMYFTEINSDQSIIPVGRPYCTQCSKDALDLGISKWVLFHPEVGFVEYDANEYNEMSFGRLPWDLKGLI